MKALFVGLGGIGQRHLRNLRALKGGSVDVIAWRVRGRNQVVTDSLTVDSDADLQQKYGIRTVDTLEAGLAQNPDVTFICNPSSYHVPVARAAVRAGSNIFIEKPLSADMSGVDELIEEASRQNCVGCVGYQLRFHPAIRELARLVTSDAIGQILSVRAQVGEYLPNFHPYEDYRTMYASQRKLGGGVILSQIHELDYLIMLLGMPARVFAVGGHLSKLELDVEDVAVLLLDFGKSEQPLPVSVHMDFVQRPMARGCEVLGSAGKIVVDLTIPRLVHYDGNGAEKWRSEWKNLVRNDLFLLQLRQFLAACDGAGNSPCSLTEGARSLRVAVAAIQSLESRAVVEIGH